MNIIIIKDGKKKTTFNKFKLSQTLRQLRGKIEDVIKRPLSQYQLRINEQILPCHYLSLLTLDELFTKLNIDTELNEITIEIIHPLAVEVATFSREDIVEFDKEIHQAERAMLDTALTDLICPLTASLIDDLPIKVAGQYYSLNEFFKFMLHLRMIHIEEANHGRDSVMLNPMSGQPLDKELVKLIQQRKSAEEIFQHLLQLYDKVAYEYEDRIYQKMQEYSKTKLKVMSLKVEIPEDRGNQRISTPVPLHPAPKTMFFEVRQKPKKKQPQQELVKPSHCCGCTIV